MSSRGGARSKVISRETGRIAFPSVPTHPTDSEARDLRELRYNAASMSTGRYQKKKATRRFPLIRTAEPSFILSIVYLDRRPDDSEDSDSRMIAHSVSRSRRQVSCEACKRPEWVNLFIHFLPGPIQRCIHVPRRRNPDI
jgi:hypothetical protein